jgi:Fe-S cluster assembly ATPase SufC
VGILDIKDLTLEIDKNHILDGLNIDFWAGHVHALVGPNGAGKSSLAFCIMGLDGCRDFSGDIFVRDSRAHVTHEAAIGSVDNKQLETLLARGLSEDEAVDLIIEGLLR